MPLTSRLVVKLLAVGCLFLPVGLMVTGAQAQKAAQQVDELFKSGEILHLEIDIAPKELEALRRDPRKYAKATLKEGDKTYKEIGIHVKGAAGSFRNIDDKASLTLNMDKFEDDQRFHGMDKFHLGNSLQDATYLHELLCGELFRAAGVPASRITHATVKINGKSRGFYYLKEGFDKAFLKRNFGNNTGNFYDGGFLRDIDQPLQLLSTKDDVKNYADLKALVAACREGKSKERFSKLEKLLDMDRFISFLVMETVTWDWDGYPMNRNNFRISYHDPKKDKITFIPSGLDQMFSQPNGPLFSHNQGMVAAAVMGTPEGRERYVARMKEVVEKIFRADALVKRIDELETRLRPVLTSVDAGAGRNYANQLNGLRQSIRQREKSLEDQLKRLKK